MKKLLNSRDGTSMRIMYLLFSFTIGGTERLVADVCNNMVNKGEDVYLYVVNDLVSEDLLNSLDARIHINLQGRKISGGNKFETLIKIAKYIKKNKIDIVHCNSFNAPELLIFSKIMNRKCKIVHTIHGMGQFKGVSKIKIILRKYICDSFIAISDSVKTDIINEGFPLKKVCRIYNGINIEKYESATYKEFDKNRIIIGCVARIMPKVKGQDILLYAATKLKRKYSGMKIIFAGGVAPEHKFEYEELLRIVKDNEIENMVSFVGNVNNIPEFLNTIDICVVPSRSEGFGLSLVEAMSMGIPCIASNIEGPKEIIQNEGIGKLFVSEQSEDLADKIDEMIKEYDTNKIVSWNNRKRIAKKYSIDNMCNKLRELYNNIKTC